MSQSFRLRVGWMIKLLGFEGYTYMGFSTIVPLIDIGIPPFLSYFLCHSMHHILSKDPCSRAESNHSSNLYHFIIVNVLLRLVSTTASAFFVISLTWEALQMMFYEVFLSLLFFSSCIRQINNQIRNAQVRGLKEIRMKYIQLQLLNQVFNGIYQTGFFGVWLVGLMLLGILSGSFFLKTCQESILFALFAFTMAIVSYICLTVVLSFASHAWTGSEEINASWKQNPQLMKDRVSRRVRISVKNMKIKIGLVNFVERMTPLNVLSFCAEQTVTIILLGK
jgi:hypothetical protein